MRDLNFFEPFLEKRQFRFNKLIVLYVLLILSVLVIAALGILNLVQINALKNEVASLRQVAEDPQTVQKVEEIKVFEEETNQFREEVDRIIQLDQNIQARDIVGENLLYDVNSKLPEGVFLQNFNVNESNMSLSGLSQDKYSVAEFARGISQLMVVSDVFVSNISEVESYYSFSMDATLREAMADGKQ